MKKIFLSFIILATVVACTSEDLEKEPAPMITETISGTYCPATKATIADTDASFKWSVGDNIAVHVSNGDNHKYVFTSGNGGASVAEAEASFSVTYESGYSRDAFAVFPSSIVSATAANYGQSGSPLDVTLPSSYTLSQVQGEVSPCPMIATNTAGDGWTFYQLCSLLRITVDNIPATAKRLEISFDGKNVAGNFAISDPKGDGSSTIALDDASGSNSAVITITKDGTDVALGVTSLVANIPLPVGTYSNFTVTAYDALTDGNAILVLTRPFAYTASNNKAVKRTTTFPSSSKAFRGYEVSTGILERDGSTDPATYSLTSGAMILTADPVTGEEYYALPAGCNPFEPAIYYGNNGNLNKYFNKWLVLREELGASGNNINATSGKLPAGWQFPTGGSSDASDWGKIILGKPKSTITVNGTAVTSKAYAMVSVTLDEGNSYSVDAGTYYGMFLLRDGSTIPSGYFSTVGSANYDTANPLTEAQFNDLIKLGCLFISASGNYSETNTASWRDLTSTWKYGYYWSSIYKETEKFYYFYFYNSTGNPYVAGIGSNSHKYYVVKLVKPVAP